MLVHVIDAGGGRAGRAVGPDRPRAGRVRRRPRRAAADRRPEQDRPAARAARARRRGRANRRGVPVSGRDRRGHRGVPARALPAHPGAGGDSRGEPGGSRRLPRLPAAAARRGATGSSAPTPAIASPAARPATRSWPRRSRPRARRRATRSRSKASWSSSDEGDPRRHVRPAAQLGHVALAEAAREQAADRRARDLGGGAPRAPRGRRRSRDAAEDGPGGFPGAGGPPRPASVHGRRGPRRRGGALRRRRRPGGGLRAAGRTRRRC